MQLWWCKVSQACWWKEYSDSCCCFLWCSLLLSFRVQVLSNSGISTVLVVIVWKLTGWQDKCLDSKESTLITSLIGGIIGHYSCCNGDTWSSEIGVLSDAQPRLITTFKVGPFHILLYVCFHGRYIVNTCMIEIVTANV